MRTTGEGGRAAGRSGRADGPGPDGAGGRGRAVALTLKELELLATLVGSPGRVFGREALLDTVWGHDEFVEPRTVDVHLARLRGKFTEAGLPALPLETVRGVGYRFREAEGTGW